MQMSIEMATAESASETPGEENREDENTTEIASYSCPYCEYVKKSERVVRTHISRAEDAQHGNRNGFMPEVSIEALDKDGNVIEEVERDSAELATDSHDSGEISTSLFPDGLSDMQNQILQKAITNPSAGYQEITDDIGCSYQWTRRTIQNYLSGHDQRKMQKEKEDGPKSYEDLGNVAKRVVDELAKEDDPLDPDGRSRSLSQIEEDADCGASYAYKVIDKFPEAIKKRKQQVDEEETDDSGEETITNEAGLRRYKGPERGIDITMQSFAERPVKETSETSADGEQSDEEPSAEKEQTLTENALSGLSDDVVAVKRSEAEFLKNEAERDIERVEEGSDAWYLAHGKLSILERLLADESEDNDT